MTVQKETAGYCKDAHRRCPLKREVMKKFRDFFDENLSTRMPEGARRYLDRVYSKRRSKYLHQALLREGSILGINVASMGLDEWRELSSDKENLEILVNASVIEWLGRS